MTTKYYMVFQDRTLEQKKDIKKKANKIQIEFSV